MVEEEPLFLEEVCFSDTYSIEKQNPTGTKSLQDMRKNYDAYLNRHRGRDEDWLS